MTHGGMLWDVAYNQRYWPASPNDRGMVALPIFHEKCAARNRQADAPELMDVSAPSSFACATYFGQSRSRCGCTISSGSIVLRSVLRQGSNVGF
jgi:hypothetical protein